MMFCNDASPRNVRISGTIVTAEPDGTRAVLNFEFLRILAQMGSRFIGIMSSYGPHEGIIHPSSLISHL